MVYSLERIQQYLTIDQEINQQPVDENAVIGEEWPQTGDLIIKNLKAYYSLDGMEIIKGISFCVKSGERIGIGEPARTIAPPFTYTVSVSRPNWQWQGLPILNVVIL